MKLLIITLTVLQSLFSTLERQTLYSDFTITVTDNQTANSQPMSYAGRLTMHNQKFSISDFPIRNLNYNNYGYDFDVCCDNEVQHFRLNMLGEYNVTNALFAIIVSRIYGIDYGLIAESLRP